MPLPTLFVIGDSISVHYGPFLEEYLRGVFTVTRKPGVDEALKDLDVPQGANGGDSGMVVEWMEWVKGTGAPRCDLMIVNCGLHDVRAQIGTLEKQVSIERYAENVKRISRLARELSVRPIWMRTTPVDEDMHNEGGARGFLRFNSDIDDYNKVADEIMDDSMIRVADLHKFSSNLPGQPFEDGVHFVEEARKLQAAFLAGFATSMLNR